MCSVEVSTSRYIFFCWFPDKKEKTLSKLRSISATALAESFFEDICGINKSYDISYDCTSLCFVVEIFYERFGLLEVTVGIESYRFSTPIGFFVGHRLHKILNRVSISGESNTIAFCRTLEARRGIEPLHGSFADSSVTTSPPCQIRDPPCS